MSYTYDSENHMLTASGNGKSISMIYDAFGNRVAKTVNGVTTQYLVEDDVNPTGYPQVVDELVGPIGSGVVTRQYIYGLQRISENLSPALTGNNTWIASFYGEIGDMIPIHCDFNCSVFVISIDGWPRLGPVGSGRIEGALGMHFE